MLTHSSVLHQLDVGIPAMTRCCNQLDVCYDTCGENKYDCDANFRSCLLDICSDLKKSLGFVSKVQGENFGKIFLFFANHQEEVKKQNVNVYSFYQLVNQWQTPSTTQYGLWDAGLTWTARGRRVSARERRGMNCDTEHFGQLLWTFQR